MLYKSLLGRGLFELDRFEAAEPLLPDACSAKIGGLRIPALLKLACDELGRLYFFTGRPDEADAISETSGTWP